VPTRQGHALPDVGPRGRLVRSKSPPPDPCVPFEFLFIRVAARLWPPKPDPRPAPTAARWSRTGEDSTSATKLAPLKEAFASTSSRPSPSPAARKHREARNAADFYGVRLPLDRDAEFTSAARPSCRVARPFLRSLTSPRWPKSGGLARRGDRAAQSRHLSWCREPPTRFLPIASPNSTNAYGHRRSTPRPWPAPAPRIATTYVNPALQDKPRLARPGHGARSSPGSRGCCHHPAFLRAVASAKKTATAPMPGDVVAIEKASSAKRHEKNRGELRNPQSPRTKTQPDRAAPPPRIHQGGAFRSYWPGVLRPALVGRGGPELLCIVQFFWHAPGRLFAARP